jgi:hypothetical protein
MQNRSQVPTYVTPNVWSLRTYSPTTQATQLTTTNPKRAKRWPFLLTQFVSPITPTKRLIPNRTTGHGLPT